MMRNDFSAKEYSILIERLLRKANPFVPMISDEILLNPYDKVISTVECRVSQDKMKKFKILYQAISGQSLQDLLDDNYDMAQLLKDLERLVE